jgi:peroxiredoxin
VVLFVGTECPINNAFMPRLREMHREYAAKGVQFLAVNSNKQDTLERIAEHAKKHEIPFPVLRDPNNIVADRFGARRTPEAFVLDGGFTIRYQGRIDDQFGIGFVRSEPTRRDLAIALDELLASKQVTQAVTPVEGCLIGRVPEAKKDATVTYTKHVAPIIQNRCQECHRPGQVGPFALLTYEDASAWSEMIREVVTEKRMPPWHADPKHGKWSNDRSLPKGEYDTLLAWINQGCPRGNPNDLPPPRKFAEGWTIGQPDAVFTMNDKVTVPAKAPKGGVPYKYFVVPTNFKEDVWIQAAEARPGNRAVVHHIIVYVSTLGPPEDGIGRGFLVGYAPGDLGVVYPAGAAKKVPKGASLIFQMHYTPNGTEQVDCSSVGLVFAKAPPRHEVKTRSIANRSFQIPPGANNHKVTSSTVFKKDTLIYSLLPHMHLRGKSFDYEVVYPDGKREMILSVPRYDFAWQATYNPQKPLVLPAGSKIECTAHFDNSADNPNNPDPNSLVRWGEQTWEEMMIGFVDYAYVEETQKK